MFLKYSFLEYAFMETLDKFDLAILEQLQADGRLTNTELAQRVGLSPAPCWRRVRALEEAGFAGNTRVIYSVIPEAAAPASAPAASAQGSQDFWGER